MNSGLNIDIKLLALPFHFFTTSQKKQVFLFILVMIFFANPQFLGFASRNFSRIIPIEVEDIQDV